MDPAVGREVCSPCMGGTGAISSGGTNNLQLSPGRRFLLKVSAELGDQHQSALWPAGGSCLCSRWKHPATAWDGSIHRCVESVISVAPTRALPGNTGKEIKRPQSFTVQ